MLSVPKGKARTTLSLRSWQIILMVQERFFSGEQVWTRLKCKLVERTCRPLTFALLHALGPQLPQIADCFISNELRALAVLSNNGGVGTVKGVENLTSSMHLGDPSLPSLLGFLGLFFFNQLYHFKLIIFPSQLLYLALFCQKRSTLLLSLSFFAHVSFKFALITITFCCVP